MICPECGKANVSAVAGDLGIFVYICPHCGHKLKPTEMDAAIRFQGKWLMLNEDDVTLRIDLEAHEGHKKFGKFNSMHELYAVLQEELDEFWNSVKANDPDPGELLQIAAVAKRGLLQLCEGARVDMSGWWKEGEDE